jgi:hypothetical protein
MGFLLLGVDSLIACLAIGPIVSRRARVPLAALFGACDGVAFLIGSAFHWQIADPVVNTVQTAVLVGLGLYLLVVSLGIRRVARTSGVWILPFALTLDNITYGLVDQSAGSVFGQAAQQAASSALLALIGLLVGAVLPRFVPAMQRRAVATSFAGGALILAAGLELVVG